MFNTVGLAIFTLATLNFVANGIRQLSTPIMSAKNEDKAWKMMGKYLIYFLLITGCQSTPPPPSTFVGKDWQLTSLHTADGTKVLPDNYGFNMRFEDGRITGKGACNDLGLYYLWRYTDSIFVFGGEKTMMACEPELRMNWDDWFVAEMLKVRALNMPDPTHLELRCNDGGKVLFKQTTQGQE